MARLIGILNGLSNTLNAAFGGEPYESVSGRAWRQRDRPAWGRWRRAVDFVFSRFGQHDHCRKVYEAERATYWRMLRMGAPQQ